MGVASSLGPESREDLRKIVEGQVKLIRMGDFWKLIGIPEMRFEKLARQGIVSIEDETTGAKTRRVKLSPRGLVIFRRSESSH